MGNASAFELDALDTRIRELIAYARERDGEDRTLLFRNLVDLFLTGKAPKKQPTRDQLLDVIEALIPHVEPDGRRTVAELVAGMSEPPLDLACRLAKDRAHLVGDILKSTAFDEADIIELIQRTGRDHHHIIASRNDLSANIWIALARAAPIATGFDNQSTLALWRDDLGLSDKKEGEQKVTPFRAPNSERPPAPTFSEPKESVVSSPAQKAEKPKAVPAPSADTGKSSQLRILRTDKDLLADRIEPAELKMQSGSKQHPAESDPASHASEPTPSDAVTGSALETTFERLADPAEGGWRWRSDRDGLVIDISSTAFRVFEPSFTLIGASILDLLGLNDKLGHPVSRALQRRSAIHDAPLVIERTSEANRFWTLEATPLFSANGGLFEGYEGTMTPIQSESGAELPFEPAPTSSVPLFQEPNLQDQQSGLTGADTLTDENIDRTKIPAPAVPQLSDKATAPATPEPVPQSTSAKLAKSESKGKLELPGKDALMAIASDMIQEMVGDSVAKALQESAPVLEAAIEKAQPEPTPLQEEDTSNAIHANEIAATLHMLSQAINALEANGETLGNSSLRLQTEIANACLKTLKEQLGAAAKLKDDI
ncbi:MAG: hypothetical protein JJ850_09500 [Kordiimonadaceae bacterium]|nr:hypothetical protein [Kordiimonadaceae bacterium]MBO6569365.1 hypothetical protein [Kordiimonadaceae bacterium]MBO6964840.1 hypothetical protein [Kordiimonadaceae bacterium]